jgi:2-polyprenyl-3-methyl-5-hydroxy-6-metoxy-1,4-benzoquinol methylase
MQRPDHTQATLDSAAEFVTATACRACSAGPLASVLSLGMSPLANALVRPQARAYPEARYPLEVLRCPACSLVQLSISVAPEVLFRDYVYFSSVSDAFVSHARALVEGLVKARNLSSASLAVEIASNDGYLLQHYRAHTIPVLGFEPARDIARVAREQRGIDTIEEFFNHEIAVQLVAEGRSADVIHANNVLAHVPDLNGVLRGIANLLKENGVAIFEVPSLCDMIDRLEFDTIYHEHVFYFSLTALARTFTRVGLSIIDVEHLGVHGGSLRVFARRAGTLASDGAAGPARVAAMLEAEQAWGVDTSERYARFQDDVAGARRRLTDLLCELKDQGHSIAAYGAAAKGTTLLNYCGLGANELDYVVDRSAAKQGLLTPGTQLTIEPPHKLIETMPDYVLLLVWNFAEEVLTQQAEYRRRGGRFIIPVPTPSVV